MRARVRICIRLRVVLDTSRMCGQGVGLDYVSVEWAKCQIMFRIPFCIPMIALDVTWRTSRLLTESFCEYMGSEYLLC